MADLTGQHAEHGFVSRWAAPMVTQPLSHPVPADDLAYRRRKGDLRLAVRSWRRAWQLAWSGQAPLRRDRIERGWKRALWIHDEAPQIGDALMDLAPRSLLVEHGIAVDLAAPPHLAALFDGDRWLGRSLGDPQTIDATCYDFVIASSDARRALATKRAHAAALPWVSLAGRYSAPDFQRAMFDTQRLADLLGHRLSDDEMRVHARQKLASARDRDRGGASTAWPARRPGESRVALACGGVRDERVYGHWPAVAAALAAAGIGSYALLGSANGRTAADRIAASLPGDATLHDRVARDDLHATREAIEQCDLLLCADGGLMHLGLTTPVPLVALYTSTVDPAWRLPPDFDGIALRSRTAAVSGIAPNLVVTAALEALRRRPD